MKLLSDASEYALRAVVWLALQPAGAYKVREIAQATRAAPGYLVKVLQMLARENILTGQRGSNGGFTLVRDPESLTVLEIIEAVDPMERILTCPLGIKAHGKQLCPVHRRIDDAMASIEASFSASFIADMARAKAQFELDTSNAPDASESSECQGSCNALSMPLEQVRPTKNS